MADRDGAQARDAHPVPLALLAVGALSALVNVLYLTGSLFMLEVYDRVLPSRSVPTLVGLAALAIALYAFQGLFDLLRSRLLVRIGAIADRRLGERVFPAVAEAPLRAGSSADLQALRDLEQVRAFLSGPGPASLFDLPWIPLYISICFAFHPWIGWAALAGALLLLFLTASTELLTRRPAREVAAGAVKRSAIAQAAARNAEVVRAMGMLPHLHTAWRSASEQHLQSARKAADVGGGLAAMTKVVRFGLQSAVLGLGALLVIEGDATGGIMIASSILVARALAPVDIAVANWRGFVGARQSWKRLRELLSQRRPVTPQTALPAPRRTLAVEGLTLVPPGRTRPVLNQVAFSLEAGQGLGIIGPSGSGKSSLARALVGAWPPLAGLVRLDGAALDQWPSDRLGPHIGYLPQDIELFQGTVAQNISRFAPDSGSDAVVAAAEAAGVHELICSLPQGYDTLIGESGAALSAGQRQRIALARALYGSPFLVVLDEPNSNLDADGERALHEAMLGVRERGGIVVVVAHRQSVLASVDHLLFLVDGRVRAFGRRDAVLAQLNGSSRNRAQLSRSRGEPEGVLPRPDGG